VFWVLGRRGGGDGLLRRWHQDALCSAAKRAAGRSLLPPDRAARGGDREDAPGAPGAASPRRRPAGAQPEPASARGRAASHAHLKISPACNRPAPCRPTTQSPLRPPSYLPPKGRVRHGRRAGALPQEQRGPGPGDTGGGERGQGVRWGGGPGGVPPVKLPWGGGRHIAAARRVARAPRPRRTPAPPCSRCGSRRRGCSRRCCSSAAPRRRPRRASSGWVRAGPGRRRGRGRRCLAVPVVLTQPCGLGPLRCPSTRCPCPDPLPIRSHPSTHPPLPPPNPHPRSSRTLASCPPSSRTPRRSRTRWRDREGRAGRRAEAPFP
jgi:hypothetical protein